MARINQTHRAVVSNAPIPHFQLIGNWAQTSKFINDLPLLIREGARQGQEAAAEKIVKIVKKNIRQNGPQGITWPQYSEKYRANKIKRGGNPDTFLRFRGKYYSSIKVIKWNNTIYAGVHPHERSVSNKRRIRISKIAKLLEMGSPSRNIQARPLWAPSFKEFGGKTRVATHVNFHIRKLIAIRTGLKIKLS